MREYVQRMHSFRNAASINPRRVCVGGCVRRVWDAQGNAHNSSSKRCLSIAYILKVLLLVIMVFVGRRRS